jgi:hypothetical protein
MWRFRCRSVGVGATAAVRSQQRAPRFPNCVEPLVRGSARVRVGAGVGQARHMGFGAMRRLDKESRIGVTIGDPVRQITEHAGLVRMKYVGLLRGLEAPTDRLERSTLPGRQGETPTIF